MEIEKAIKQKKFTSPYSKMIVNIFYTSGWLTSHQTRLFKPYGLSLQQYNVLRILRGQYPNPASVGLVQERMLDPMSNASRLIDKLVEKKMVERRTCKTDRRQAEVLITAQGLNVLSELDGKIKASEKELHTLTREEAETLSNLLDKLRG